METKENIVGTPKAMEKYFSDYWKLMKPELTGLSVFTSLASAYLALPESFNVQYIVLFLKLALGTMLVGGGAGVLNQYIERELDEKMERTRRRPLPAQRLLPLEALFFGIIISVVGFLVLTFFVNFLAGFFSMLTLVTYLFLYTPLKKLTPICTIIGAIPGALPIIIGWVAIEKQIDYKSLSLFAIIFYWQMPHFYSLAWLYRKEYKVAGFKILTVVDEGIRVKYHVLFHTISLCIVSFLPVVLKLVSPLYSIFAIVLNLFFLRATLLFCKHLQLQSESEKYARKLFYASLVYIPFLFIIMLFTKI